MQYVKKGDEINNPKTKRLEAKKVYDKNNKIVLHPRKRTKTNKDHTDYSSRGESSALESEKKRSEISELDEGDSIKGVKSPINSPNSKKNRNRSLKNTPEIDTDEEMGEEQTKYRKEIARNCRKALQQNILHFPKFQNFVSAYDRDFEYSSDGDDTLTPSQLKNTSLDLGETSPQSQDIPPQTLLIEAQIIQNEAAENPKSTKPEQNTASSEPPLDEKTAGIIEKIKEQAKIKEEQTKLREINATKIKMEKQAKIASNKQKEADAIKLAEEQNTIKTTQEAKENTPTEEDENTVFHWKNHRERIFAGIYKEAKNQSQRIKTANQTKKEKKKLEKKKLKPY
ncbi:hypothetical protein JTB14_035287 [Gonioctena quinquepunctata]|nr:hypothetical protein JTB14_035287 [Gonioctena quinquepunctata]